MLRCILENKSTKQIRFKPGDVRVRAGDASYTVQLADSSGLVSPGKKTMLDLVLQGNEGGGKEHISIDNDFRLEVPIDHSPPPPNDLLPPSNPLLPSLEGPGGGVGAAIAPLNPPSGRSDVPMLLPLPSYERQK